MSRDDSAAWRARAEEMRALVDTAEGRISKELLLRIAEDYEWFAQIIEERPNRFVPAPDIVPAEVRQYGERGRSARPAEFRDPDPPSFLKRRPAKAD
jgi:hypothetical protein